MIYASKPTFHVKTNNRQFTVTYRLYYVKDISSQTVQQYKQDNGHHWPKQ